MLTRQCARYLRVVKNDVLPPHVPVFGSHAATMATVVMNNAKENQLSFPARSQQSRGLSSYPPQIHRAFPQYSVHGETHLLSFKMIFPGFRLVKGNALTSDPIKKGKLLVEMAPRSTEGSGFKWNELVKFALAPEEVGLICSQLPHSAVELSRPTTALPQEEESEPIEAMSSDMPDKVLKITPGDASTVKFEIDFIRDGVGGQEPGLNRNWVSSCMSRPAIPLGPLAHVLSNRKSLDRWRLSPKPVKLKSYWLF